jgi:hypothetical protein
VALALTSSSHIMSSPIFDVDDRSNDNLAFQSEFTTELHSYTSSRELTSAPPSHLAQTLAQQPSAPMYRAGASPLPLHPTCALLLASTTLSSGSRAVSTARPSREACSTLISVRSTGDGCSRAALYHTSEADPDSHSQTRATSTSTRSRC